MFPIVPGHEIVGRVVRTGDQSPGSRWAVSLRMMVDSCRTCPNCREGAGAVLRQRAHPDLQQPRPEERRDDLRRVLRPDSPIPSYSPQLENAAGVVSIAFGGNNGLGGKNQPVAGGWVVPLLKATVEADGKVIVRDGKLVL